MTDNRLRKLRRPELLEMLLELEQENEQLALQNESLVHENQRLREELAQRATLVRKVGDLADSLAQASLQMSDVFACARDAATSYLAHTQETTPMAPTTQGETDREEAP